MSEAPTPLTQEEAIPVEERMIVEAPIFVNGMTEQEAINYIGEKIRQHKEYASHWKEEDILIRNQLVIHWLGLGIPTMEVNRRIQNFWGVTDRSATTYIGEATKWLTASSDEYREHMREVQLAKLERWAEECRLMGKYLEASKMQEQINKLLGLYEEKKKIEVSGDAIKFEFDK